MKIIVKTLPPTLVPDDESISYADFLTSVLNYFESEKKDTQTYSAILIGVIFSQLIAGTVVFGIRSAYFRDNARGLLELIDNNFVSDKETLYKYICECSVSGTTGSLNERMTTLKCFLDKTIQYVSKKNPEMMWIIEPSAVAGRIHLEQELMYSYETAKNEISNKLNLYRDTLPKMIKCIKEMMENGVNSTPQRHIDTLIRIIQECSDDLFLECFSNICFAALDVLSENGDKAYLCRYIKEMGNEEVLTAFNRILKHIGEYQNYLFTLLNFVTTHCLQDEVQNSVAALLEKIKNYNAELLSANQIDELEKKIEDRWPDLNTYDKSEFQVEGFHLKRYTGRGSIVKIPKGVKIVDDNAFPQSCSQIKDFYIPKTVKKMGHDVFCILPDLVDNELIKELSSQVKQTVVRQEYEYNFDVDCRIHIEDVSAWCDIEWADNMTNPILLTHSLYLNEERIVDLIIPDSVSNIKPYAFEGFYGKSIRFTRSLSVGVDAFCGCNFEKVYVPNIETLRFTDFANPEANPLRQAHNLYVQDKLITNLLITGHVKSYSFVGFGGKSVSFYSSLDYEAGFPVRPASFCVEKGAFLECDNLCAVQTSTIEQWFSIEFEDKNANPLYYAGNLYLTGDRNVRTFTDIGSDEKDAWSPFADGVHGAEDISIVGKLMSNLIIRSKPDTCCILNSFREIPSFSLVGWNGESIMFDITLEKIGKGAFLNCNKLKKVIIVNLLSWCEIDFKSLESNPIYYAKELYIFDQKRAVDSFSVSKDVCNKLVFPPNVSIIKPYAFAGYRGTEIAFSSRTGIIKRRAFYNCKNLARIINLPSIEEGAFEGCDKLLLD